MLACFVIGLMKGLYILITMNMIISFSISILASYFITNSNILQTDTICDIYCDADYNHDGRSTNPTLPFHLNPDTMLKNIDGSTVDPKYDIQMIVLGRDVTQKPQLHEFYDIVSTQIGRTYNEKLVFTISLNDDPNKNKKYETTYLWVLSYFDRLGGKNHIYTIIIPNFGIDSKFKNKGWYVAIYDNINNIYSLPISRIDNMTNNNVEVTIDPIFIGNIKNFNYSTAVMIRVDDEILNKPPDYLIDSSPNDNTFWTKWFL